MSFPMGHGPDGTAHLWGGFDYDLAMGEDENPGGDPFRREYFFVATCRNHTKRAYEDQEHAEQGALTIKDQVEWNGGTYTPLTPYKCPDGGHWHLTSHPQ